MLIFSAVLLCAYGQVGVAAVRETRPLSSPFFDEIHIEGGFDVSLTQLSAGSYPSVEIETTPDAQRQIRVDVVNGHVLSITVLGLLRLDENARVYIRFIGPLLRYTVTGSGGTLTEKNGILTSTAEKLFLERHGSADLSLQLDVPELHAVFSGSANIQLTGQVRGQATFDISGSVEVDAMNLVCQRSTGHSTGSSTLRVTAVEDAQFEATGSAEVFYRLKAPGQARHLSTSGSATITRLS